LDERIQTQFRIPKDVHERLTKAAKERELSVNYIAVKAIEEFLGRLIPVEEFKLTRD
jgi:predicted HicB family RNase H-like nuclease